MTKTARKTVTVGKFSKSQVTLSAGAAQFDREFLASTALVVAGPVVSHDRSDDDKAECKLFLLARNALPVPAPVVEPPRQGEVYLVLPAGTRQTPACLILPARPDGKVQHFECKHVRHGSTSDGLIWVVAQHRAVKARELLHLVTGAQDDLLLALPA